MLSDQTILLRLILSRLPISGELTGDTGAILADLVIQIRGGPLKPFSRRAPQLVHILCVLSRRALNAVVQENKFPIALIHIWLKSQPQLLELFLVPILSLQPAIQNVFTINRRHPRVARRIFTFLCGSHTFILQV